MWSIARPLCDSWASCLLFLLHIVVRGVTVMAWDGATSDGHVAWFDSRMFRCHLTTLRNVMQLHWLPVRSRVQCKLCTLMHAIHNKRSPSYLSNAVQTLATSTTRCGLRSSATIRHGLYRAAYIFKVRRAGLRVCRSRCLEPPSGAHSSPVHTCNL